MERRRVTPSIHKIVLLVGFRLQMGFGIRGPLLFGGCLSLALTHETIRETLPLDFTDSCIRVVLGIFR